MQRDIMIRIADWRRDRDDFSIAVGFGGRDRL
jgi:hypothetical protein